MNNKDSVLSVRLPADLRAWLDQEAEKQGCQASTWIRMLLIKEKTKKVEEFIKEQTK